MAQRAKGTGSEALAHAERRDFIIREVNRKGHVSYVQIRQEAQRVAEKTGKKCWPTHAQTFSDDEKIFAKHHLGITRDKDAKGKGRFVKLWPDSSFTFRRRLAQNREEKEAIGEVAAALMVGSKQVNGVENLSRDDVLPKLHASEKAYGGDSPSAPITREAVVEKIKRYSFNNDPHRG